MSLGWTDKLYIRIGARKVKRMDGFKRWAPFVGSLITVVCAGLKATGYEDAASAILGVVAYLLPVADTHEQALATTAAVSVVGLVLQLVSRYEKARRSADSVSPR